MADFELKFGSAKDWCYIFCCPPLPTHCAAKFSLMPPAPSYAIGDPKPSRDEDQTQPPHCLLCPPLEVLERDRIDAFTTRSSRGNQLACIFVRPFPSSTFYPKPKFTLLYSHGNACDVGQMSHFFLPLSSRINCNIFGY